MELIFEKEINLLPAYSKTNIFLPFMVGRDYEVMKISFSYSPKELKDRESALKLIDAGMEKYAPDAFRQGYKSSQEYLPALNLITLSLDSPACYVGCAHKHSPEQEHILTEKCSSPGFVAQKPVKGVWQAVVNVHNIVTESCTCHLKIFGSDESGVML